MSAVCTLAADVGGTHTRVLLAESDGTRRIHHCRSKIMSVPAGPI